VNAEPWRFAAGPAAQEALPLDAQRVAGPTVRLETRPDGVGLLLFDPPPGKVNLLESSTIALLELLIGQAGQQPLKGLIVASTRPDVFIAGADVREIQALRSPQDAANASRRGQRLFSGLEDLSFPVVAAISGACMGGGTELALACHYRVAADHPRTSIGLPEVRLGILPGWGGTQRLPRLVGLAPALDVILNGRALDARRARQIGLVDEVVPPEGLQRAAESILEEAIEGHIRPRRRHPDTWLERANPARWMSIALTTRVARRRLMARVDERHYPAPYRALEAAAHGLRRGMVEGLAIESEFIGQLAVSPTCRGLVALFNLTQAARRDGSPAARPGPITAAAVIGAGVMGGGIASALSRAGLAVRLKDVDPEALAKGMRAAAALEDAQLGKRRITRAERDRRLDRILPTLEYTGLRRSAVVIEAVVESLKIKHQVLRDLEAVLPPGFVFATNTSSIPIADIAAPARRPEDVVGLHFFNPVDKMPLVEVVRGPRTSEASVAIACDLARRIGKTPVVVGDAPGFLVNRVLMAYLGEALLMFEEGAQIEEIDRVMLDFGMPMGPFALLDQVGLDVVAHVAGVLTAAFGERAPRPSVPQAMKEKGWFGRKSGRGFYHYRAGDRGEPDGGSRSAPSEVNDAVYGLVGGGGRRSSDPAATETRLVLPMINEAVRCLESGIASRPEDVDLAMVLGTGFPPFRGGLLRYADYLTVAVVVQGLQHLADRHGPRFQPARSLLDMTRGGRRFFEE
jgi:3-hydroxyacyl-CoA dehydrogenase/enoyl-CoA hydratase/3-hydroxybutyryl-CoA epimerase